jgi:chitinase
MISAVGVFSIFTCNAITPAPGQTQSPPGPTLLMPSPTLTSMPSITTTSAEPGWCSPPGALDGETLIIGYIPEYRTLDPLWGNCLTDIIFFSLGPMANGTLDTGRLNPSILETMQEIKRTYGTRIHVSLGGYGRSDNFSAVVTNPQLRNTFLENLVDFAAEYDLDGIDFDWEFPETPSEIDGYVEMLSEIKQQGLIVSVALYPYGNLNIFPYLIADRIHIMSYNRGVRHSTFEQAVADLAYFESLGAPREKLILGIPFYGRQMNSPYHYFIYSEIVAQYDPAADVDEVADIYFNGITTVWKKTCYTQENGYAGVMVWELGQDNGSLVRAIHDAVATKCEP